MIQLRVLAPWRCAEWNFSLDHCYIDCRPMYVVWRNGRYVRIVKQEIRDSNLQSVLGVKVNTSGFNSRADAASKTSYTRGSNSQRFGSYEFLNKGLPQQAEVAQGVQGRLRPRIFMTFGTTRVVGRQPYAPAAFTPRRNPWYSFLEAESTPGHMVPSVTTDKIPSNTTENRSRGRPTSAVP